jgi:cytochrome b
MSREVAGTVAVRVWDLPTRLFHWSLVLLVTFSAISGSFAEDLGSQYMDWHQYSGFAILALLGFRLMWGVVGSTYARFSSFVRGPKAVAGYLQELLGRKPAHPQLGHNPLGGLSVLAMLAALLIQTGSGLFIEDEDLGVEGPLSRYVSNRLSDALADLHEGNFEVLLFLIGVHLAAIAFYRMVKRENLVGPMVTGVKRVDPSLADRGLRGGHPLLALALISGAAFVVWALVTRT